MFQFGSGNLWATQTLDAYGNTVALPTPIQFGVLQDVSTDLSFDEKFLHGSAQFPVDAGRGKGKFQVKAKFANINLTALNATFFGQTIATGMVENFLDVVGQVVGAGNTVVITPSGGWTWVSNLAVRNAVGVPYVRVAAAPAVGQYTLAVAAGVATYTFNIAELGKTVFVDYKIASATLGKTVNMQNLPMGAMPFFALEFSQKRNGKGQSLSFPRVTSSKLGFGTKQDDFLIPELDMMAIADENTNTVVSWASFE